MATIVRMGYASGSDVEKMIRQDGVGEIAGWWFDRRGHPVAGPLGRPVGLGIAGLYGIVERGGHVIAVVAGSWERVAPLRVALETGLVNVLFTDDATARELLT
jgi:DNA-binding transcriptional regulator LsrR (DeoR family)